MSAIVMVRIMAYLAAVSAVCIFVIYILGGGDEP